MTQFVFSPTLLKGFVEEAREIVGLNQLTTLFKQNDLPESWLDPGTVAHMDEESAAEAYTRIQQMLRTYFGRGARNTLLRIGRRLWEKAVDEAPLAIKTQAHLARGLPMGFRPKATLDVLAKLLGEKGQVSVHTLDLDLVVVDRSSPIIADQTGTKPSCFVTLGLIQGAMHWATGREVDAEETSCRSTGKHTCEFRIKSGA